MAIFKCKMCGGALEINNNETVATCEYCGTQQTLPKLDDDRRANLYDRANHFRRNNEFDKAMGIYEQILNEDNTDAEVYWSLVLCRYGIEYVEDPSSHKRIPTVNRAQFTSIFDDDNYKSALQYADGYQRSIYEEEAKAINEIQKGILAISQKEEPFDVFICYKETDNNGRRTPDSVLANDLYHQLTQEGFKVFFARITLEDKLGSAYEPYIFAALNSAKVMVVLGTKPEFFKAVWVRNEWSRYLSLVKNSNGKKVLIPAYKDMDPYDLPEEFSHLQAQDMAKLGFMQDLIRGIKKLTQKDEPKNETVIKETVVQQVSSAGSTQALLKRGNLALEDNEWERADGFFEEVLNLDAECAEAYLGKLLASSKTSSLKLYFDYMYISFFGEGKLCAQHHLKMMEKHLLAKKQQKYVIPFYLPENEVADFYSKAHFEYVTFSKSAKSCKTQLENALDNNLMKKAKRFATNEIAATIENETAELFRRVDTFIEKTRKDDKEKEAKIAASFEEAVKEIDKQLDCRHAEMLEKREKDYAACCARFEETSDLTELQNLSNQFLSFVAYKESEEKHKQCIAKIRKIEAEIAAMSEKQEAERKAELERKRKKNKKILTIISVVAALAAVALIIINIVIIPTVSYNKAVEALNQGSYIKAFANFTKAKGYKDAAEQRKELFGKITNRETVAVSPLHAVAVKKDGTVIAKGSNAYEQCNVYGWTDIIAVSVDNFHTVGLKSDGTVVATGDNDYGQCDVSGWKNIVAVSAGNRYTIGLKSDGTVVATGRNDDGQCDVSGWTDIVAVSAGSVHTVGLKSDGTVVVTEYTGDSAGFYDGVFDVSGWTDIIAVSVSENHTVGLKSDGTVVATGENYDGRCDVSDWTDIVAVSATEGNTVGLKSDGTIVAVGDKSEELFGETDWTDVVAVSEGGYHSVGLKSGGTVVVTGKNDDGQCDISGWKNIVDVSAGYEFTVGLKSDGTVVATGGNDDGQCDVSDWTDIADVSVGKDHTVGLKIDGTVVATGNNFFGQSNVSEWKNIIDISVNYNHTVGLRTDGTVVAKGKNTYGECDVSGWTNIVDVSAGGWNTVGVKSNGTVVATGYNEDGQCDVSDWTDIVAVSAGDTHTVGLKSDGTVVAIGSNSDGQCDVSGWTDIVDISVGERYTLGIKSDGAVVVVGDGGTVLNNLLSTWNNIRFPEKLS